MNDKGREDGPTRGGQQAPEGSRARHGRAAAVLTAQADRQRDLFPLPKLEVSEPTWPAGDFSEHSQASRSSESG